jgi:hypothetical protein
MSRLAAAYYRRQNLTQSRHLVGLILSLRQRVLTTRGAR